MEIIDTRRTAQEEGRHRWRSLFCEEAVFCAGQALDKGGRLQPLTHHRHPPRTKSCAWEGCPGVASLFQAHSCLGTLGTRVPLEMTGEGGGAALVPCAHPCQLERWLCLLKLAERLGRRRKRSPSEVLFLPLLLEDQAFFQWCSVYMFMGCVTSECHAPTPLVSLE